MATIDKDALKRQMRAADFKENNGIVMRAINAGYVEYTPLKTVFSVLPGLTELDFLKAINYLQMEEYIKVRHSKTRAETEISDANFTELEAKLSSKGIKLSGGFIEDELVPM